jgi:hypothetical protein
MAYRALLLLAGVLAGLSVAGCSYTSEYVPPQDGRARPIWVDDAVQVAAPADLPECVTREQPPEGYTYTVPQDQDGYYYSPGPGPSGHVHVHVGVVIIGRPPLLFAPTPGFNPGSISGDGGKYLAVGLAVGAIIAFPFIAMGLALGHPEPEEEVAGSIDALNTWNDQARERMERCAAWYEQQAKAGAR